MSFLTSYVVLGVASFFLNLSIKKRATPLVNIICYITLNNCFFLTIRLRARDFYAVIVDEGEARINYHRIEIESE